MKGKKIWAVLISLGIIVAFGAYLSVTRRRGAGPQTGAENHVGLRHQPRSRGEHLDFPSLPPFSKAFGEKLRRAARSRYEDEPLPDQ